MPLISRERFRDFYLSRIELGIIINKYQFFWSKIDDELKMSSRNVYFFRLRCEIADWLKCAELMKRWGLISWLVNSRKSQGGKR